VNNIPAERSEIRFHFVLDNSASMGRQAEDARVCFSELVSLATGPCSLVAFAGEAKTIGTNFTKPMEMRAAPLPRQGQASLIIMKKVSKY